MGRIISTVLILTLCYACQGPSNVQEPVQIATTAIAVISPEEEAINQAVLNCYQQISFEDGTTPNYEMLRSAFTDDAVFKNFRNEKLSSSSLDEFMEGFEKSVREGQLTSFNEVEIFGETEHFGKIAHRISTYASYINGSEEPQEFGINSWQLINLGGEWKVNSIIWDVEKEGQPIPRRYK